MLEQARLERKQNVRIACSTTISAASAYDKDSTERREPEPEQSNRRAVAVQCRYVKSGSRPLRHTLRVASVGLSVST